MYVSTRYEHTDAKVRTNVVANPIPIALSSFLDTPINGQSPKNLTSTKLFTRTVPISSKRYSVMPMIFMIIDDLVIIGL
ncbi:hypothetical protein AFI02nite_27970 [Aliivibrio fischeri]|uniref:Uncharacterized protein n=1 Tax=Aliivibrio fischeri TaxID=668 RepID=A0A510UMT2_ALIFS|nr:hypothetical protein AFI02nite_27970 [Aliivibrio fischeri]